jgi:3,4-dihydroxy 2-butanone 4-phosphate synthase/GTP cyclohydrolase II
MEKIPQALLKDAHSFAKKQGQPLVTLSYAQSLDGSLTVERGKSTMISGPESLKVTHALRAAHDAILVGIGTVLADNPQLTVREVEGSDPIAVVLDSRLRFPLTARLLQLESKPWIFCSQSASEEKQSLLENEGARVFRVGSSNEPRVNLSDMLKQLAGLSIESLMVEGGPRIIASFVEAGLSDAVAITIAPVFIGGLSVFEENLGKFKGSNFPRVLDPQIERFGEDYVYWGKMERTKI